MAKPRRKQKLKVFRTPIGFHDAYVAAPSQKAALEAWGIDSNLFARGSAGEVTDPELTKVPLAHPGQVVKVLRGTEAEQLAALAKQEPKRSPTSRRSRSAKAEVVAKPRRKEKRSKPKRTALTRAEQALAMVDQRQEKQREALEEQEKTLEQKRRELERRHERERDKAQEKVESEREKYREAIARYESG